MSLPFSTTRRVEFADTDMAGIVHFSNFFRYMESAEVEFLRSRGLNVKIEWEGQMIGFPRVAASCDFIKTVTFGDLVDIAVTVERIGKKSVTYGFEFTKQSEVIARGKVTSVCCRVLEEHRLESMEMPASFKQCLEDRTD